VRGDRTYWLVVTALVLLAQYVAGAGYLSIDNVNLAFALEYFDPLNHQPQPPGYPFFVLLGKVLYWSLGSVEYAFFLITAAVTLACLPLTFLLTRRLFSESAARIAVLLLAVNPVFWQTAAESPLRPFLFLFSLLTAYCALRCWQGETAWLFWGAIALGVGSGFRPELLPFLFPLWLVSAWVGSRSVSRCVAGITAMAAIVLIWVAALVVAVGGVGQLASLISSYLVEQSRNESPLMGAGLRGWLRQMGRLIVWNGTAVFWWAWAVPVLWWKRTPLASRRLLGFLALWVGPALMIQALTHAAAPGHTGATVGAFCILGAHVLSRAATLFHESATESFQLRETFTAAAVVLNVMLFLNFFPMPEPTENQGPSIKNMMAYALAEASIGNVRSMDAVAYSTLKEIREFTPEHMPSVLVASDVHSEQWMLNWRIVRYYEPEREIWAISEDLPMRRALKIKRFDSLKSLSGETVSIPVPVGGRILFLLDPKSRVLEDLRRSSSLKGGRYVGYVDLPTDAAPMHVAGFEFMPSPSLVLNSGF